jgi:hypothetical protein
MYVYVSLSCNHGICILLPVDVKEGCGVVEDLVLLEVEDEPGHAVRPLLDDVDPRRQAVPAEVNVVGSQQSPWQ